MKKIRFPVEKNYEDLYVTFLALFYARSISVVDAELYYYFLQNTSSLSHSFNSLERIADNLNGYEFQMDFSIKNKSIALFQESLISYICYVYNYCNKFADNEKYTSALNLRKKHIKLLVHKHHEYMPEIIKKYGYRRIITQGYLKVKDYDNDIESVKKEKGKLFSYLCRLKQIINKNY